MLGLIVRRSALALLVALTVMTLAFLLTRLSGDLAISIAGPQATQADVELVRKAYGLDRPLYIQLFDWAGRAMIGVLPINFACPNLLMQQDDVRVGISDAASPWSGAVAQA